MTHKLFALLTAFTLTACLVTKPSTGELGKAEFAWDEGLFGCLFGCNAGAPMATRATAGIEVKNYKDLPTFSASTDNAAVADFLQGSSPGSYIRATSHKSGDAKLILTETGNGAVLDRLGVRVNDVARIQVADPKLFVSTFTIVVDGSKEFQLSLHDAAGNELKGIGAVDYAFAGGLSTRELDLTAAIDDIISSIFVGTTTEYAKIKAHAVGGGSIQISSPAGGTLTIPAAVVDATAITRVELPASQTGKPDYSISVDAAAFAGNERAWSPLCAWTLEPPTGDVTISSTSRDHVSVISKVPASAKVTCTINGQSASTMVSFHN